MRRYSKAIKADVRADEPAKMPERCPYLSRAGHSHALPPGFRKDVTPVICTPEGLRTLQMRRSSAAVKADVRRRMSPPNRQSVTRISAELGIHIVTLFNWRKAWRLQDEVVAASWKEPTGWAAFKKCTVVLETAGLKATELSA
jgi:transposase-like protein